MFRIVPHFDHLLPPNQELQFNHQKIYTRFPLGDGVPKVAASGRQVGAEPPLFQAAVEFFQRAREPGLRRHSPAGRVFGRR